MFKVKKSPFMGVYWIYRGKNRFLATKNMVPGFKSCNEELIKVKGEEFRVWDPRRSKAAAYILKKGENFPITEKSKILYLGIASGTTASYLSDIIGKKGVIFGIDVSPIALMPLINIARKRENICPILSDARKPWNYSNIVPTVEVMYCDVAQPNPSQIVSINSNVFLRDKGFLLLAVKASSIDISRKPQEIYREEEMRLRDGGFEILDVVNLEPYHRKHAMIVAVKEGL